MPPLNTEQHLKGGRVKSSQQTLQTLVSPEILAEIQASFLRKHGAAICLFDHTLKPLLDFPQAVPALSGLSDEQRNLFESFFHPSSINADLLQRYNSQSFADHLLCRAVFPVYFEDRFMGLAVVLFFRRSIHPEKDESFLQTLSLVKHRSISLKTVQDDTAAQEETLKALAQELQNIIQLFLEAGVARAQVSNAEEVPTDDGEPVSLHKTAILFCAPDGQIVDSDANAADVLGYRTPGELCDLNFIKNILATDYDREKIRLLFQAQPGTSTSVALMLKDESTTQAEVQVNLQRTSSGIVGFECLLSAPQNENKTVQRDEPDTEPSIVHYDQDHLAALQSSYRLMQHQLTHIVSPLTHKLDNFFNVDISDETIKRDVADIHRYSKALTHLNQQLACFVLQEAPDREVVDVNPLVIKIAEQLKKLAPPSVTIQAQCDEKAPHVSINSELIVHAVGNLCKNSIEAMKNGGTLLLGTRSRSSNGKTHIAIFIKDSGPGLSPSMQNYVFEPFHSTKKNPFAGLGLPAAYGIITSHGGTISVTSQNGVTVSLVLPAFADVSRDGDSNKDKVDVKGYVLIIDDELDVAEVTAMALRRSNYGVFTCTTCEEADDVIKKVGHKLDLFIIDNQLIGIKGIACAQDLMAKAPDIPILFYSGEDDPELLAFIKQSGAGWLKKPFSAKELVHKVDALVQ